MKDKLKRLLISIPILEMLLFRYFHFKSYKTVAQESERRKKMSLFKYTELCAPIPFGPEERVFDNNLYGQAHHIKKYAGIKKDLEAYIEHGLFWGGMVHQDQHHWHFNKVITYSARRKEDIEAKIQGKTAIPVGPYIHYAEPILSDSEYRDLKDELGKTLLVFPGHSVINLNAKFDTNSFIKEIERLSTEYDTVLISLYYLDALNHELTYLYESKGYKVVSSGHRYDQNFISRQKTIIQLADMTMSNEVGTHVGYCVHLGKPHYLFQQEMERIATKEGEAERHNKLSNKNEVDRMNAERREISNLFSTHNHKLSQDQIDAVAKYWGTDQIKSKDELVSLLT